MASRAFSPLLRAAALLLLAGTLVGAWAYTTSGAEAPRVAQLARTRAVLNDAICTFSVAVRVRGASDARMVERRQSEIRDALAGLLRTKSRYMVSTATAREALRAQMLREVNRVIGEPAADTLLITEFLLL